MAYIKFFKVTAMPATPEANAFYLVLNDTFSESYVTSSSGVPKAVGNSAMINALIAEALSSWTGGGNAVEIVADIAARDALIATLESNAMILVVDATGDPTVDAGSALYAYAFDTETVYKIAEYESMDISLNWGDIVGGPSSSPAQIDTAVSQSHTHANKAVLDKFSEASGELLYNGQPIPASWTETGW